MAELEPDEAVLLVGTGLTMVDMVVSLFERQHQGKVYAVSRRGLLPLQHQATPPYPAFLTPETAPKTMRTLIRRVRIEVEAAATQGYDWRAVADALRPVTQQLWQQLPLSVAVATPSIACRADHVPLWWSSDSSTLTLVSSII